MGQFTFVETAVSGSLAVILPYSWVFVKHMRDECLAPVRTVGFLKPEKGGSKATVLSHSPEKGYHGNTN